MRKIQMVDLKSQYENIKGEVDRAILDVINSSAFINGPDVKAFSTELAQYNNVDHAITCGNGTDALQIAMMGLDLKPGDEVIVPSFTYVATAEVIALLRLTPVFVDVNPATFNIDAADLNEKISPKTKAIVVVHLFGQCTDMEPILEIAEKHDIYTIEDTAQAIGAEYTFSNGKVMKAGTIGTVGTTSFFPSKNLGCYGDGGAIFTRDAQLAERMRMIANHGQKKKYYHDIVGINSRLDTVQAAILRVKLKQLDSYCQNRNKVAAFYDENLSNIPAIAIPKRDEKSTHVFHQYTIKVKNGMRDDLKAHLATCEIPSMIYYPLPLHKQQAYKNFGLDGNTFPVAEQLCEQVLSLPIHTEMAIEALQQIVEPIINFFDTNE